MRLVAVLALLAQGAGAAPPERLHTRGAELLDARGRPVVLQGVNMYLEWYKDFYGKAVLDVAKLRQAVPAANCIRFVALLWKDSIKPKDGIECSNDDASQGYLKDECILYIDALIKQATDAGLWVIIAARAKYAAGWGNGQDVWNDPGLREKMYKMWAFVAKRYKVLRSCSAPRTGLGPPTAHASPAHSTQ